MSTESIHGCIQSSQQFQLFQINNINQLTIGDEMFLQDTNQILKLLLIQTINKALIIM